MSPKTRIPLFVFSLAALGLVTACNDSTSDETRDDGATANGGSSFGGSGGAGTGGANATGGGAGTAVTGGSSASAGTTSAGGTNTGSAGGGGAGANGANGGSGSGSAGAAGATPSGGNGGIAGSAGVVGSSGTSGANADGGKAGAAGSGGASGGNTGSGGASGGAGGKGGAGGCPVKLEGWATTNADGVNGTTGGGNATPTTVTTLAAFRAAVEDSAARVIVVSGTIRTTDGDGYAIAIRSNKTIVGANKDAKIYGGLTVSGATNVIIRNLNIQGVWPNSGPDDSLATHDSHHVWFDHLNVWDAGDGLLDITNESNYVTVSWSKFWYTDSSHPHRLASLNGSGGGDHPEDSGKLKVTYHHNWWSTLVNERMPRVMYGIGHQYNNYFNAPGNLYCIGVGSYASTLVENNYFKDVRSPHILMYTLHAHITARGNVYDNTTGNRDTGLLGTGGPGGVNANVPDPVPFTDPPYDYALDAASNVPTIVQACAGPK